MEMDHRKPPLLNLKAATFLFLITVSLYCLSGTTADPDLWGYLAFGRLFWGQAQFPYLDVFAYVPTLKLWVYHEWLTGVVFYPIYRILGASGLQMLKYVLGLGTLGAIYLTARRRGADPLPTALILFFVILGISVGYSPVRAQVFTYFFFALFLYLLENARLSGQVRGLWVLAPLQIVWCNLHGGFIAGLGLIFLYALGEALSRRPFRPYLWCFLMAGLATLINPYGLAYWSYLARAVTMPRPEITEWVSLWAGYQHGFLSGERLFFFLNLLAAAVILAWWARWREITPILVLLGTGYLGVTHSRHWIFFMLAFGAYLPVLFSAYFQTLSPRLGVMARIPALKGKVPALVLMVLLAFFAYRFASRNPLQLEVPPAPSSVSRTEPYYPVGAIDFIGQRHLSGKLLVDFTWGEYCLWRLYPRCLVAIDGRYETAYSDKIHQEYFDFLMARKGWRNFLEHYPPDLILIDIRSRVYGLLSNDPEWRQVYADSGCALFRRQGYLALGMTRIVDVSHESF